MSITDVQPSGLREKSAWWTDHSNALTAAYPDYTQLKYLVAETHFFDLFIAFTGVLLQGRPEY